jgi:hypothetical protein
VTDPSGNTVFVIGPPGAEAGIRRPKPTSLMPLAHVASVPRSIAFYERLGLDAANTHTPEGGVEPVWAWLRSGDAHLMVARADAPVIPDEKAVFFYLYTPDVAAFRQRLLDAGIEAGAITYPFYSPRGEFRVTDPDGYALIVAHT